MNNNHSGGRGSNLTHEDRVKGGQHSHDNQHENKSTASQDANSGAKLKQESKSGIAHSTSQGRESNLTNEDRKKGGEHSHSGQGSNSSHSR